MTLEPMDWQDVAFIVAAVASVCVVVFIFAAILWWMMVGVVGDFACDVLDHIRQRREKEQLR